MELVLLSGGSGTRLWPLSNQARSKQFLPLLEKPDGSMESMVQRVVRQVTEAGLTSQITLATNVSQCDIITNQLGEKVSVVTEPERRDTFPAIALAASYLKQIKGCPEEEVVVIMPCDPYTERGYFEAIGRMARAVEQQVADLVLMGITPTYPSAKYGYVVPEPLPVLSDETFTSSASAAPRNVLRFTEKPTVEVAEQLLAQGALWNGGVFAFRLGYMMKLVRRYVQTDSFEETRARYSEFPKISFDYEVSEKATSVAVVPYTGEWKDLGTWNTLTDELHRQVIGNAVIGPKCVNTHVINELKHPIFVDGLEDVVVAACPDGILVCAKKETENIKKYVENLSARPRYEECRWGSYQVLDESRYEDGHHSLTKSITLLPGRNTSYQMHRHRKEVWTFVEGEGSVVLDAQERKVQAGDVVVVPQGCWHAVRAHSRLTLVEVQSGYPLELEDVERCPYEWETSL